MLQIKTKSLSFSTESRPLASKQFVYVGPPVLLYLLLKSENNYIHKPWIEKLL